MDKHKQHLTYQQAMNNIPDFIYPPRAEVTIPHTDLDKFDNGEYFGQPKYNGDCTEISFDGEGNYTVWNRHKEVKQTFKRDMRPAYRGSGRMVICGEYLAKNQLGEFGQDINHSFVIWDILVYNNQWLIGNTTEERLELLEQLYPCKAKTVVTEEGRLLTFNHLCCTEMDYIFKTPTYTHGWTELYHSIVQTPLYEGFVLKKRDAKLEYGFSEINNNKWQVKCRKPTKNYQF